MQIQWIPPGPIANRFYHDDSRFSGIQGPVGSAKTTTGFHKGIKVARQQMPSIRDGVRRVKGCIVHKTYRQLWRATIPSWGKILPQDAGRWEGAKDSPARHEVRFGLPDGTEAELVLDFVAIGDHAVEDVLRGYEPTFFFLNEADLLPPEIFDYVPTRWGRFPSMDDGGPTWWGAFMDFNAPVIGSFMHEQITEGKACFFSYHRQPGGMEPGAENRQNLPATYYEDQIAMARQKGEDQVTVDRMVHNKFGQRRDGKPIFPEFNDALHVSEQPLEPLRGLKIKIGFDAGLTPAGSFWQTMPNGQWRGLDEVVTAKNETMGVTKFGEAVNRKLKERFEAFECVAWCDPAAAFGGDDEDASWMQDLSRITGLRIRPAPGNNRLNERFEAERQTLIRLIDGREPGMIIDPRMKFFRRGMGGAYRFRKLKTGEEKYKEEPEKNDVSHVCESSQYAKLGGGEYDAVKGRQDERRDGRRQTRAIDEDNPRGEFTGGARLGRGRQRAALD